MKLGNLDIKDIYVGSTPAAQMYFGNVKIWPEEQPAGDYWGLCFTAEDPGVSVSLHANSASAPQVNLLYSTDAVNWQTFTSDSTTVVLDNAGDKVWLKAGPGGNAGMGSSTNNSHSFRIENGRAAASGSIMSLLSGEAETYEIPAGQEGCFAQLFSSASIPNTTCLLTRPPDLPATTLGRNCYRNMFQNCTSLTAAPELPAMTAGDSCYYNMFYNCGALSTAPALPAKMLANNCYKFMFSGCSSLTAAPALPATVLSDNCYTSMFSRCTSLSSAPALPATTLANNCYYFMFGQCTSLSTPPALPISTLYEGCYQYMFYGCTALTTVPALPATVMSMYCYQHMFEGCSGLSTVPEYLLWNVTQRSTGCYDSMFKDCTSLTSTPRLTANYLPTGCYTSMFANDIALISAKFPSAWDSELTSMFADDYTGGKTMFEDCDASQVWVTYVNGADWLSSLLPKPPATVEGLKFTHVDVNYANITLSAVGDPENNGGHCDLVYSTDGENWSSYTVGTTITLYTDDYVIFKAAYSQWSGIKSVDDSNYYQFVVEGQPKVEGDISYLYSNDPANDYLNSYQFAHLFEMCDFNTGSGYESEITLPSRGKWMASSASYAFKNMFNSATLSRIKIPVDPDGWDSGAQFDGNFTEWVYDISQGYDQSPTFWIPQGWTWSYGYSAVPYDWSVQYSE